MREEPPKASAPGKEKERETRLPVRPVPAPAPEKEQKGPEPKRERPSIIREEPKKEEEDEERKEKRSFFSAISDTITKKAISDDQFENMFWDLEMALMESNVAMEVIGVIKRDLKERLVMTKVRRGQTARIIQESLRQSIETMLANESPDLYTMIAERRKKEPDAPFVVLFVGVNGSGKTTNLAKVAHYLKGKGLGVVLAACDTFRAAAIQQLELHGENLGLKVIRHDYGSDAAAVAFDAIGHAKAKRKDVVLIDSAGRSHANTNLMDELKKLAKVAKPDLTVFVGDSLTGNDAVEQAKTFDAAVGVDAVILAKLDVDEKGGAAISVSQVTKKPILFVGTGQSYEDIRPFHPGIILESLGLDGAA
ncbi:signal recognition particle-docking protein FtsY [Candidatus Woesearchaeota archaeon]|nr:signal recognition particle-docking protein FtsY [Candidatus Woesearchaeota archaeon]